MTEHRKRSASEVWRALEEIDAEAELRRINGLSDAEVDRELRAAGLHDDAAVAPSKGTVVHGEAHRAARRRWFAAAATAAACCAAGWFLYVHSTGSLSGSPNSRATELRKEAFAQCQQGQWALCERKLDEARAIDPKGENDSEVMRARQSIDRAAHPHDDHGPLPN